MNYLKGKIMEDIICLKCNDIIKADGNWDFIDGEKHKVTCSCGYQFVVIIERPIEYYIQEVA
ncbi:MAG: hypothetical protein MUC39_04010 [Candidatus Omnitrophica bacterium]|nr:hypothetical protein [Candidatus Omnitrophota bacterium]